MKRSAVRPASLVVLDRLAGERAELARRALRAPGMVSALVDVLDLMRPLAAQRRVHLAGDRQRSCADATPGQVQRLLSAGASAYLTKPFDVRELLRIVDGVVT